VSVPRAVVTCPATILVIDNYDSFVFNLVQYLEQLGARVIVRRNDQVELEDLGGVDGVLISPGPGTPERAGMSMLVAHACILQRLPLLGVCLGHQVIAAASRASVVRAPELLHGKTSEVLHDGTGVLAGLPSPLTVTRYHSLAVTESELPPDIIVTGRTASGVVMSLRHAELPIDGVQFHPESVLTQGGHRMLANWLEHCDHVVDPAVVDAFGAEVEAMRAGAFAAV
jgi:para-aminobenzoate synthetase component 2